MMDVVVYNYWSLPVIDVFLNGQFAGLGDAPIAGQQVGGGGMVAGVAVSPGKQIVKWMLDGPPNSPRLGEKITATFNLAEIPPGHRNLAINIYADKTVFIETGKYSPDPRPPK